MEFTDERTADWSTHSRTWGGIRSSKVILRSSSSPRLLPARVVEEFKGFYRVRSAQAEYLAEAAGKLQHLAVSREDLPAVGDWVAITARPGRRPGADRAHSAAQDQTRPQGCRAGDERTDRGHEPRYGVRGERAESRVQPAAHRALSDHGVGQRRTARHPAQQSGPLSGRRPRAPLMWRSIALGTPVRLLSALEQTGLEAVREYLSRGTTAAFVGSSGVGKSTIINGLADAALRVQSGARS